MEDARAWQTLQSAGAVRGRHDVCELCGKDTFYGWLACQRGRLFRGTDGCADGEQRRDFVHVDHVVAANLFFIERPPVHGIFNVGTGTPRTFNEMVGILIKLLGKGQVEYIPFPEHLRGKYQNHTRADLSTLRNAGFTTIPETLEDGLAKAVEAWAKEQA